MKENITRFLSAIFPFKGGEKLNKTDITEKYAATEDHQIDPVKLIQAMRPSKSIVSCKIKCDVCGWDKSITFDDVPMYHNVNCPDCDKGVLVTDQEMEYWKVTNAVVTIQDAIDPEMKSPRKHLTIDTAPTRTGKEPSVKIAREENGPA